jgi:hypothetical protein
LSLADARAKIEAWRRDFNECRPHTSLGFEHRPNLLHRPVLTPADEVLEVSFQVDGILGEGHTEIESAPLLDADMEWAPGAGQASGGGGPLQYGVPIRRRLTVLGRISPRELLVAPPDKTLER